MTGRELIGLGEKLRVLRQTQSEILALIAEVEGRIAAACRTFRGEAGVRENEPLVFEVDGKFYATRSGSGFSELRVVRE